MFKTGIFFILSAVGFSTLAGARTESSSPVVSFFKPFQIGVHLENYRYSEPGIVSHTGLMFGVHGVATWAYFENVSGLLLGELSSGELNYDGALCDVNTNLCTDYEAKTNNLILRLTHRFDYVILKHLHVFGGPGFRYLIDRGQGTGFYTRMASYFFIPAGIKVNVQNYSFEIEYEFFLKGMIKSQLSEVNRTFEDITHSQENGKAFRVTAAGQFSNITALPLVFSLYYEKRELPSSDFKELQISGVPSGKFFKEPENITEILGFRMAMTY